MAGNISVSTDSWEEAIVGAKSDPRVADLPLMSSIQQTTLICLTYVLLVKGVGPWYMKDRKPYNIKYLMMVYNLLQTLFSGWVFVECTKLFVYPGGYSWHCQPVDYSRNPEAMKTLHMAYFVLLSKFVDMLDSIFFVMRKKFNQLSVLHVIHHGAVPWFSWWGAKFAAGGHSMFGPWLNCGVHALMYFYYFLSACGPQVQKHLWWKKYLTSLQLVQFVAIFIHALQPFLYPCDYLRFVSGFYIFNTILFFGLFSNFYIKSYVNKKANKKIE